MRPPTPTIRTIVVAPPSRTTCPPNCYDRCLVKAARHPLVDLVIVNYRSYEELSRCLGSLECARRMLGQVTVVDHESNLTAAAGISLRFPWIELVERSTNEGFATGVNLGAARGRAEYVLLLNPDCVAGGDAIERLVSFAADHRNVAVVGPRILNPDGTVQGSARRFPGWSTFIAGRSSWLTRHFPGNPLSRWNLPVLDEITGPVEVDWISGACMLIRRDAFHRVSGMDEQFFLYWEDADLCKRLGQDGWRTIYLPTATIEHACGRSSIHAYRESLAAFHASAFTLFRKHAGRSWQWLAPVVYVALRLRLRALLYLNRHKLTSTAVVPNHLTHA
jgi:GT2 family glycosyltransferase